MPGQYFGGFETALPFFQAVVSVPGQHLGGFETALPFFQAVVFGLETTLGVLPQFLPGRVMWLRNNPSIFPPCGFSVPSHHGRWVGGKQM